ncbi:nucleotide exchange factor GrpE [Stieleria varia]|uniref:Protein GrpE n=1 Tax=Stieleria varia TaxID=2528005 RepID=A0A5C6ASG3_9BACT|nr:nucleotide exchange factor GrpE [Stieleria varia]TWU01124.1 Protein GrpE [Stieleria varia]
MIEDERASETRPDLDQDSEHSPQFGLLDVIESFTAMRHECRGQIKTGRELVEQVQQASSNIQAMQSKLESLIVAHSKDATGKLVAAIADLDHQLTRAIDAAIAEGIAHRQRASEQQRATEEKIALLSPLGRWFAKPLVDRLRSDDEQKSSAERSDSVVEGLNLILSRLRQTMTEYQIERLDTVGTAFDGRTMNSIGTVPSDEVPVGHVAIQVSPCYLWHGNVLRFANVRVSG